MEFFVGAGVGFALGLVVSMIVDLGAYARGRKSGAAEERNLAIRAKAGKYVCDEKTGRTIFVYGKGNP